MGSFVFALVLLVFSLLGIAMRKIYYYLPAKELKRQAENGDKLARALWRAVAYGASLRVLLWFWIGLAAAGGFVLLARVAPWFFAFVAIALLLVIDFAWFPRRSRVSGLEARVALAVTPAVAWLLGYLHPALERTLARPANRYPHEGGHTGLYESDDLLELIERQAEQADSRISPAELQRAKQALQAGQYRVRDVLTPRDAIRTVSDADTIGLVLLDELHASNQSSFPVRQGKTDKIIGALYLHDLNLNTEGKVRDYMQRSVRYLHEDDSLAQAVQAFFKTKHQLFVVVNGFEEYVGIVTLEHMVQQLAGGLEADDFDQHDDLAAVAGKHAHDNDELPTEQTAAELPAEDSLPPAEPPLTGSTAEPEMEVVLNESGEVESSEIVEDETLKDELAPEPVTDEPAEPEAAASESDDQPIENPDDLAALDLPEDDDPAEQGEGTHVVFKKPKESKPAKSKEK